MQRSTRDSPNWVTMICSTFGLRSPAPFAPQHCAPRAGLFEVRFLLARPRIQELVVKDDAVTIRTTALAIASASFIAASSPWLHKFPVWAAEDRADDDEHHVEQRESDEQRVGEQTLLREPFARPPALRSMYGTSISIATSMPGIPTPPQNAE